MFHNIVPSSNIKHPDKSSEKHYILGQWVYWWRKQCLESVALYYVAVFQQLKLSTLILCILCEDCIEYALNMNVNALTCNGYFSAVWCSCSQITAMHNKLWIKWASDVGQWFQKRLRKDTSRVDKAKLKLVANLKSQDGAVCFFFFKYVYMTQSSLVGVVVKRHCLLKATLQKSVFVSPFHSRTRLHFICQWSRLFAQDQDSKHFSSQRPANHRRVGISFIFPSSVCKTWKHVVQIRSKKEEKKCPGW